MKHPRFFLAICLVSTGAGAQPAPGAEISAAPLAPEQRRAELRQALKPSAGREVQAKDKKPNDTPEKRLSVQERADLRQQLRQQRPDVKPDHP